VGHRIFAAIYDRLFAASEDAGLRDMRAELLAGARGRTLEIGGGTGHNLPHYTEAVTELVVSEPSPPMRDHLRELLETDPPPVGSWKLADADAEQLPFEDSCFDTVTGGFILCSISHPEQALAEIARVQGVVLGNVGVFIDASVDPETLRHSRAALAQALVEHGLVADAVRGGGDGVAGRAGHARMVRARGPGRQPAVRRAARSAG
jgi:ubiquinone/menaquinone biosynthesis C-methylase UbiE